MSDDLTDKVAVASGSAEQIKKWSRALGKASIPHTVANSLAAVDSAAGETQRAELWVRQDDADPARAVIQAVHLPGEAPMW
jgi:hypothetical protein